MPILPDESVYENSSKAMMDPWLGKDVNFEAEGPDESPERAKKERKGSKEVNLILLVSKITRNVNV